MKRLFPGDDNSLGDANRDKYYRYIGLVSEIRNTSGQVKILFNRR